MRAAPAMIIGLETLEIDSRLPRHDVVGIGGLNRLPPIRSAPITVRGIFVEAPTDPTVTMLDAVVWVCGGIIGKLEDLTRFAVASRSAVNSCTYIEKLRY